METGQWVDGDLYNGRIVIANSYVLNLYLIIQEISLFLWDEIKIPIQYGRLWKSKEIILRVVLKWRGPDD
jgi:hypothetical protein